MPPFGEVTYYSFIGFITYTADYTNMEGAYREMEISFMNKPLPHLF